MTTALGSLGGPPVASADERGTVRLAGARWSLAWAVRSEDGWIDPGAARASALTQRRIDGTPVVETSLRVKGGHTVHRAFAARSASGIDAVVVEVENASPVPIGVALLVAGAREIDLAGERVAVDRGPGLALPRPPSRSSTSIDDVLADGGGPWPGAVKDRRREATAGFVFPLAHTARLSVVAGADVVAAGALPDAARVVAGWSAHLAAGLRVELPDAALVDQVRADLADLLLAATLGPDDVVALDRWGHSGPARQALEEVVADQALHRDEGAWIVALAEHARLGGDIDLDAVAGPVAAAAHRLRRTTAPLVQRAAAELLDAAGQAEAAALCRSRAGDLAGCRPSLPAGTTPAARLNALRDVLVDDDPGSGALTLVPAWPEDWLGRPVEVHGAPTRVGPLSFAVRWHGARPALLWERAGGAAGVTIRAGLDPSWSTTDSQGEALLAPVEPAGGLPAVVAPLAGARTPVDEAPPDGPGFT